MYCEHAHPCTVARLAPTGAYVASADQSGKVRIWDALQATHSLKLELQALGGPILDMAWSNDAQRIVAVGEGREKCGVAFFWDSGASVGEISGHSKFITTCDFKQTRPFKIATGSEDFKVNFYDGPPFKYVKSAKDHTRFVNCVRFSPNGEKLVSVGSDKLGFVYDGKTGDKIGELTGHEGGVLSCCWSPDSTKILTASADKTCKIWDASNFSCLTTFTFGNDVNDQQVGCLWQHDTIISVSLSGDINYLDQANPNKPAKVVKGHNKVITALAFDREKNKLLTGDYGADVIEWDVNSGDTVGFTGPKHGNQVSAMAVQGRTLVTVSMDDSIKITNLDTKQWGPNIALGSTPNGVAVGKLDPSLILASCVNQVAVVKGGRVVHKEPIKYQATCIALKKDEKEIAVGGADNKIHIYTFAGDKLQTKTELSGHRGALTRVQYSADGRYLASADANREVIVWDGDKAVTSGWVYHSAKVNGLAWCPDNVHVASGGLDGNIIIWNVAQPNNRIMVKLAHFGGVKDMIWLNESTLATVGQDCALKTWKIQF
jgi:WD40 repeat protein